MAIETAPAVELREVGRRGCYNHPNDVTKMGCVGRGTYFGLEALGTQRPLSAHESADCGKLQVARWTAVA